MTAPGAWDKLLGYPRERSGQGTNPFPGRNFPQRRTPRDRGPCRCALLRSVSVSALVKQLVEAGVHFGHRVSRWNPKMRPYIYARRNLIHIIDIRETVRGLLRAKKYLKQVAARR